MKIRWAKGIFIRHQANESAVWCPRTNGCTIMSDVQPFLCKIVTEWREESDIISEIANGFECDASVVTEDAYHIFGELLSQGFIEREGWCERLESKNTHVNLMPENQYDESSSPLDGFCGQHSIPAELHVDLTNACTEHCVHCYVPQAQHDFLPYAIVEKLLREFRATNGLTVHLTGGEAMLHPDFERICRLCVELKLNFLVFSNLTLCDENRIAFLKEVDPQFINVSLYSMEATEHDAITCLPGSWQKTMGAILACEKSGVHIRLAAPLLKPNQNAYPALKRFADDHHMHLIPACDIVPRANHTCSNLDYACSVEEMERTLCTNKGLFDRGWTGEMPDQASKVCDIGVARLYVNAKGEYYPCDCMHGYVLGNVRENKLSEIWRGEKLAYLRRLKNCDFGKCASCEHRPYCKVCPAFNFNATGDLFTTIPEKCRVSEAVHRVYGRR